MAGRENQPVLPAAWVGRDVSEELSGVLDACLSPQPRERPSLATFLTLVRAELERWRTKSGQVVMGEALAQEPEDGRAHRDA